MANKNVKMKEKFLELLSKDRNFCAQVIEFLSKHKNGLVTTTYLDKALEKLSKHFDEKLAKQSKEFDEKLAKQSKEFDEKLLKLRKELSIDMDEKLAKQSKEFDEKLSQKLTNQKNEIIKEVKDFVNSRFSAIGSRWGIEVEKSFRETMVEIISKEFNAKVEKWEYHGIVQEIDDTRDKYEVDICITANGKIILLEYKISVDYDDVVAFIKNCKCYEKLTGKKATRKILSCIEADKEAKMYAGKNNIELFYYNI